MGADRERAMRDAMLRAAAQKEQGRRKKRERLSREKPWQVLQEEWHEQMRRTFGKGYVSSPWSVHEPKLARLLLKEVELDVAVTMVRRFIETWDKPGTPSFGYFWKARDSVRADMEGRTARHVDEYSRERDGKGQASDGTLPKIGW